MTESEVKWFELRPRKRAEEIEGKVVEMKRNLSLVRKENEFDGRSERELDERL